MTERVEGFLEGRESVRDDKHSGRPSTGRADKTIERFRELIKKDRGMSVTASTWRAVSW